MQAEEVVKLLAEVQPFAGNSDTVLSLPSLVKTFAELSAHYRASGEEQAVLNWISGCAEQHACAYESDAAGNLLVRVPACDSVEERALLLQGHVDMICVGPADFDWLTRGVELEVKGEWLTAKETSLGADNGVAVTVMVELIRRSRDFPHPPFELLFTVQEEIGLIGAQNLDASRLESFALINLDAANSDCFTDSCAGGQQFVLSRPLTREVERLDYAWQLRVTGLPGGHSGLQIADHCGNAILLLYRCWQVLHHEFGGELSLSAFDAGQAHNIIPSEGVLEFGLHWQGKLMSSLSLESFEQELAKALQPLLVAEQEFFAQLHWTLTRVETPSLPLSESSTKLLSALLLLPNGIFIYNNGRQLVELSANLGRCSVADRVLKITNSFRYSRTNQLPWLRESISTVAELYQLKIEASDAYACWQPSTSSQLRSLALETYQNLFQESIYVVGRHSGLECGVILDRIRQQQGREMEALAMGPTIKGSHSVLEKLWLPGFRRLGELLVGMLARIAQGACQQESRTADAASLET